MTSHSKPTWQPRQHADAFANMLQDDQRMAAYRAVLDATITPKSVVADVGTGLGVLALFAAKAGAKHVYAIEKQQGAADLAQQLFAANEVDDRITIIVDDAREAQLPEPVDIVVSETMGTAGSDEQIQAILGAFCRRNLSADGVVIPRAVRCLLAPSSYSALTHGLTSQSLGDLNTDPLRTLPGMANMSFRPALNAVDFLSETAVFYHIKTGFSEVLAPDPLDVTIEINKAGVLRSFALWFRADIGENPQGGQETIENQPGHHRASWSSAIYTIAHPITVEPGDQFKLAVDTGRRSHCLNWQIRHRKIS